MSPFKPGDRIERIALPPDWNAHVQPELGQLATVVDGYPLAWIGLEEGQDILIVPDMLAPHVCCSYSYCWRRIDGPSGESAESFLQSLSKPKVTA